MGASSQDPRSLHRYTYARNNPLNATDPTGEIDFTAIGTAIAGAVDEIVEAINATVEACISSDVKTELVKDVAGWVLSAVIAPLVEDGLKTATNALVGDLGGGDEAVFHNSLARYMCYDGDETVQQSLLFEAPLTKCGANLRVIRSRGELAFYECVANIAKDWIEQSEGVDIVVDLRIPIELKIDQKEFKSKEIRAWKQLVRYCRFAANQGTHLMWYGFVTLPEPGVNADMAMDCFRCWQSGRRDAPNCDSIETGGIVRTGESETVKKTFGSIYIGFGVNSNTKAPGQHLYFPQPGFLGCK
jgi:hypothetical protein